MSVFIKGMEMPTEGGTIVVYKINGKFFAARAGKDELCPLFPVPPHGRLIDADELKALVYANIALFDSAPGRMGAEQKVVRAWLASMVDDIDDAPTILEAEEGEA